MDKQLQILIKMSFRTRFLKLRKKNNLTQQQIADKIGMHISQVKRYESGEAQPSIDLLKKIAQAFNVTTDWLVFDEGERDLPIGINLMFEAVSQMSDENQQTIKTLIDGMKLKQTSDQLSAQ